MEHGLMYWLMLFLTHVASGIPFLTLGWQLGRARDLKTAPCALKGRVGNRLVCSNHGLNTPYRTPAEVSEDHLTYPVNDHYKDTLHRHHGPQKTCPACGVEESIWVCNRCGAHVEEENVRHTGKVHACPGLASNGELQAQVGPAQFCNKQQGDSHCRITGDHLHQRCRVCLAEWVCEPCHLVRELL